MEGSYSKGHIRRFAKLSDVLVSVRPLVFSHSLFTRKDTQMNGNTTFVKLKMSRWVLLKSATIMVTPLRCSSFCPRRYTIHTQCSPAFRYWQTRWSAQECWHIRKARCYQNGWFSYNKWQVVCSYQTNAGQEKERIVHCRSGVFGTLHTGLWIVKHLSSTDYRANVCTTILVTCNQVRTEGYCAILSAWFLTTSTVSLNFVAWNTGHI